MIIFENEVVKHELSRLNHLIGTDGGRDVEYDIDILRTALKKINDELLNGKNNVTIVECNMWEECHKSLDKIIYELNLKYDDGLSNYDYYQFAIKKKNYLQHLQDEYENEYE